VEAAWEAWIASIAAHGGLEKITPAMAAGVIGELWTIEDLYDAVMG